MSFIDTLLTLDGIKGESQDKQIPGAIQLLSFEISGSATGADNPTAGRVRLQDVIINKRIDSASMALWTAMVTRKPIRTAKFVFRRSTNVGGQQKQEPYLECNLSDVYVVAMAEHQGEGHEDGAEYFVQETVTLNFSKIEMTYIQQYNESNRGANSTFGYTIPRT